MQIAPYCLTTCEDLLPPSSNISRQSATNFNLCGRGQQAPNTMVLVLGRFLNLFDWVMPAPIMWTFMRTINQKLNGAERKRIQQMSICEVIRQFPFSFSTSLGNLHVKENSREYSFTDYIFKFYAYYHK
jgi:short subunit dehydrogenase-like uncharacterized protein